MTKAMKLILLVSGSENCPSRSSLSLSLVIHRSHTDGLPYTRLLKHYTKPLPLVSEGQFGVSNLACLKEPFQSSRENHLDLAEQHGANIHG